MNNNCTEIRQLLVAELAIIQKHLDDHKWFQHIEDKNDAVGAFIFKYG